MNTTPDQTIEKQGANARAAGVTIFENPYYKRDQMPAVTGEPIEAWIKKSEAWARGWAVEDAARAG